MNYNQVITILEDIDLTGQPLRNCRFFVSGLPDYFLQLRFTAADGTEQRGRKWRLSPYMGRSELVQTALAAVLAALEHEAREAFLYRGAAVFGPHIDVEALRSVCPALNARRTA